MVIATNLVRSLSKFIRVSIPDRDYWLLQQMTPQASARIALVSIPDRDYWLLQLTKGTWFAEADLSVSIPDRDYWLLQPHLLIPTPVATIPFQSLIGIIGYCNKTLIQSGKRQIGFNP
ncbi:hypothetical protein PL8927_780131 [Planktothrix serta PCC 8927]|uniref:Uncharacterized protein n=1 Tax=Planktothrix serta PCC 8927 TaxID=671068 RepID=A0A7Z9BVS4_9CYAN|nr:hypothetical protein PL8927_780131 [Planktothrix serta PCC 8927]